MRVLLRPSPQVNAAVLGIIGRALTLYEVQLHAFVVLANRMSMLLTPRNARQLSRFMGYVKGNMAKIIGGMHDWYGPLWHSRYRTVEIADAAMEEARLRHLLASCCAEGLVASPRQWPGASCVSALLDGTPLTGVWLDRHTLPSAGRSADDFMSGVCFDHYPVSLTPLPSWRRWSEARRRAKCREMVAGIEAEFAARKRYALPAFRGTGSSERHWAPTGSAYALE